MIKEFQNEKNKLSTYVPWIAMIDESIILNRNGTFQKTLKFRGHDLDHSTKLELQNSDSRLNNVLRRLEGNWTMHIEARRVKSREYKTTEIMNYATKFIDDERKSIFEKGIYYESEYYLTLTYLIPKDTEKTIKRFFIEEETEEKLDKSLEIFKKELEEILVLFQELFLDVKELTPEETYTYLHSCISTKEMEYVQIPEVPLYIANYLCDCEMVGGLQPELGEKYFSCISIQGFPNFTETGFFDGLNRLGIEYRWVTRFMFLDKIEALSKLEKKWKATFNGRISLFKRFMMQLTGEQEPTKVDEDALGKAEEIETQLNLTRGDIVSQGFYSCTLIVYDSNEENLRDKVLLLEKSINRLGFTTIHETINAVEAFLGSIPGNIYNNVRIPIVNSITLTHLLPTSCVWGGDSMNYHLNQPSLMYTKTSGSTPFRFNIHVGDVGHTSVVGPTGHGKSVFLGLLAAQFFKYPNAQVFFFDKDASSRVLTYAMDGTFYDLGEDNLTFQPLQKIGVMKEEIEKILKENPKLSLEEATEIERKRASMELEWANEWLLEIFIQENIELTPIQKGKLWDALELLSTSKPKLRTLSNLNTSLNDRILKETLEKFTIRGSLGRYFDSSEENISFSSWQVFEMGKIMHNKSAITPLLSYLFHKIEEQLTGKPTILVLDECWMFFDNEQFSNKIREWLKVLRKKNTSVIFATQELGDIMNSKLFTTILDACQTKIFLPNANAFADNYIPIYEKFGLNQREIEILSKGTPKKEYYYRSSKGARLFELALGEKTLKLIAASDQDSQKIAKEIYKEMGGGEKFVKAYLGL